MTVPAPERNIVTELEKQLTVALEFAAGFIAACQEHGCPAGPVAVPSKINDALAYATRVAAAESCLIETDGNTVWVNARDGWCIARFSKTGIDIHTPVDKDSPLGSQGCLDCKAGWTDLSDWERFAEGMERFYRVHIEDYHKPTFLKR